MARPVGTFRPVQWGRSTRAPCLAAVDPVLDPLNGRPGAPVSVALVSRFLALLAIVALLLALAVVVERVRGGGPVLDRLRPVALPIATAVAGVATAGSLYYSEVVGFLTRFSPASPCRR